MSRLITSLALTASLLGAGQALAQSVPQPQPVPFPAGGINSPASGAGNGGLILSVWDTTQPISLVLYTGLNYTDVLPSTNMQSASGHSLDFGTISGFSSTFAGSNAANIRYSVFAGDQVGANDDHGVLTTLALGSSPTAIRNSSIGAVLTAGAGFVGQLNQSCSATNPCIAGPGRTEPYAGAATWGAQYGSNLAVDASGAVDTALGFYWLDRTSATGPLSNANVVRFQNSPTSFGQWLLSQTGALTYSIQGTGGPVVPLPAAVWLLLSGLAGFGVIGRRNKQTAAA